MDRRRQPGQTATSVVDSRWSLGRVSGGKKDPPSFNSEVSELLASLPLRACVLVARFNLGYNALVGFRLGKGTAMRSEECDAKLRLTHSEESGRLCFKAFNMPGAIDGCGQIFEKHLVGRPLEEVDPRDLLRLKSDAPRACLASVIRMVRKNQRMFARGVKRKAI